MKEGIIYITTNLKNGKQYVGQTIKKLSERISEHERIKKTLPFSRAIKKYGIENFKWFSYSCPEEDLDWHERFLIKELNTLAPNGYNLDSGGHKNKHHHETTKEKISEKNSGEKNGMFNKHHTEEAKQKMKGKVPWNKGIPHTEETKEKIRKNLPDQKRENNPFYGKHHTIESKEKIRLAHLRRI